MLFLMPRFTSVHTEFASREVSVRLLLLGLAAFLTTSAAVASEWTEADTDEDGYSIDEGDCDDGDPEINPGVKEICDDGIDNDCDVAIDFQDPECTACGACSASPFRAPPATAGVIATILVGLYLRRRSTAHRG